MGPRSLVLVALLGGAALSAGTPVRPKPDDYPARAAAGKLTLAGEYLVRSFSGHNQTFIAPDSLVVEVAVYPASGETVAVSAQHFSLRLNGKKEVLMPISPGFVAAAMKYPDWQRRPTLVGVAGAGDRGVILGAPPVTERFPGDPSGRNRLPAPPRAPEAEDRGGLDQPAPVRPEELLVQAELPQGEVSKPVSGYLYFPFRGKTKSIRAVELIYNGPGGPVTLRLLEP